MKKLTLAIIALLFVIPFISHAQTNTFPSTGSTGIGTTSPTALLHLTGSEYVPAITGSSQNSTFRLGGTSTNLVLDAGISTSATVPYSWLQSRNQASYAVNYNLALNPNGGNVGIGLSNPGDPLTVNGNISILSNQIFNGSANNSAAIGFQYGGVGSVVALSGYNGIIFNSSTTGVGGQTERMRITNTGKVGIGTDDPDQLLSVKGIIHSQEVKVDLTGWSDYVFKPTYKLPSLSQVKTYIDQNQHLPDVPSEEEMVKNGLNVGEMNKLLMKKVEELTLYLIQQKEKTEALEQKVNALAASSTKQ